jgi:hypothetical protein
VVLLYVKGDQTVAKILFFLGLFFAAVDIWFGVVESDVKNAFIALPFMLLVAAAVAKYIGF